MSNEKKVLIVEDDESIRKVLKMELEKEGIVVFQAENGEEAIKLAEAEKPNVLLLDIIMPKMHGMDMMRKIQENEWGKNIPIIILTNFADDPRVIEAVREGRCDLLKKAESKLEDIISKVKEKLESK